MLFQNVWEKGDAAICSKVGPGWPRTSLLRATERLHIFSPGWGGSSIAQRRKPWEQSHHQLSLAPDGATGFLLHQLFFRPLRG